ncbi:hypothetical protein U4Y67_20145 [Escherichia coli]|nr:hypothetical protein [Escherichia coli]HAX9549889.1 hypothetical protein [Escherichia coli]HCT8266347.1 hypothetical protein [Escherichia coli]HDV3697343.1 hypothetical protein [Escherichia coli]
MTNEELIQTSIKSGIPKWFAVAMLVGAYTLMIGVPLWVVGYLFGIEASRIDPFDGIGTAKYLLDKVNSPELRAAIAGGVVAWVLKK